MKKRKWYSVSKIFIVTIIGVCIGYFIIPAIKWTNYHLPYFMSDIIYPSSPHSTTYLDSDFVLIREPANNYPATQVIFYKVINNGSVKRVYTINHCNSYTIRPSKINSGFYFPGAFNGEIIILKDGYVKKRKVSSSLTRENVVYLTGKFFILTDLKGTDSELKTALRVFDKDLNLLREVPLHGIMSGGFVGSYLYKYNNMLWIWGTDDNYGNKNFDNFFVEIDPRTLKVIKTVKFPYVLDIDGDLNRIVPFKGKIYVLGGDYIDKPHGWSEGHDVIYELSPTPRPIFISPWKTGSVSTDVSVPPYVTKNCYFSIGQFVPVNPDKNEFILIGDSAYILSKSGKPEVALPEGEPLRGFLYFTASKKFIEIPSRFSDPNDSFYRDTGVFCRGHLYIGRRNYLLEFDGKEFKIVDRFEGKYDAPLMLNLTEDN